MPKLLTDSKSNYKTGKGDHENYLGVLLHLAPARSSGAGNVCEWASKGCIAACLNTSGRARVKGSLETSKIIQTPIHGARIRKSRSFLRNQELFMKDLIHECKLHRNRADKSGRTAVARLNATSDISWETILYEDENIMEHLPRTQFYDYTKSLTRAYKSVAPGNEGWPDNYHLTLSRTELWEKGETEYVVKEYGVNVAVVFEEMPHEYEGIKVIDGTEHDWRFLDPCGVVVGLLPLGRAKQDKTGFVVRSGK